MKGRRPTDKGMCVVICPCKCACACVGNEFPAPNFPQLEEEVIAHWRTIDAFQAQLQWSKDQGTKGEFSFYDGTSRLMERARKAAWKDDWTSGMSCCKAMPTFRQEHVAMGYAAMVAV